MNVNLTARDFNTQHREAEAIHRARRLRIDWHTREALRLYLASACVREALGVAEPARAHAIEDASALLAPYRYLDLVSPADFRWEANATTVAA